MFKIDQEDWYLGFDWDENLPKHLDNVWYEWFKERKKSNCINILRHYLANIIPDEFHHFYIVFQTL